MRDGCCSYVKVKRAWGVLQCRVMMGVRGVSTGAAGGLEQVPDAACEVAFEAANRFAAAFAFGLFAGEVGGGVGVEAALREGEAV